jgi:hypothetical protein
MPAVAITILIAFFVIIVALVCMGIGLLLTGKPKIKPGACGRDPNKIREEGCGDSVSCQLCDKHDDHKHNDPKDDNEKTKQS